jgi:hypothetical protein
MPSSYILIQHRRSPNHTLILVHSRCGVEIGSRYQSQAFFYNSEFLFNFKDAYCNSFFQCLANLHADKNSTSPS